GDAFDQRSRAACAPSISRRPRGACPEVKEQIRQRALQLGFDDCRFTTAQPPNHAEEFKQWLAERRHGEMAYLDRNAPKRVDPKLVLPGAKSIIVLAASYASPTDRAGPGTLSPTGGE